MLPRAAATHAAPISADDAARISRGCSHVSVPAHPVAAGYRYYDLGGELPPFYVRRLAMGDRSAAVALRAPVERSSGADAERGAPAIAACEITLGLRRIPWDDLIDLQPATGESALLARRALEAVLDLELYEHGDCPLCSRVS
jgi:hypothetical protein